MWNLRATRPHHLSCWRRANTGFPTIYHVHVQWIENSGPGPAVQPFPSITSRGPSHRTAKLAAPMLIVEAYFFQSFFFLRSFHLPRNKFVSVYTLIVNGFRPELADWLGIFTLLFERALCLLTCFSCSFPSPSRHHRNRLGTGLEGQIRAFTQWPRRGVEESIECKWLSTSDGHEEVSFFASAAPTAPEPLVASHNTDTALPRSSYSSRCRIIT